MTMRIWHQSYTDLSELPGYRNMLTEHAKRVCSPGTQVDVHGVAPGTFPEGLSPVDVIAFNWPNQLVAGQIVENAMRAEKEGYDAMAISCFVDPGLEEVRSLVDIPVVSACETALLVSSAVGRAFGLLTLDDTMVHEVGKLVYRYGYQERVTEIVPLDPPLNEYHVEKAFAGSQEFVDDFTRQARQLVANGADLIIPAENVLNICLVRNGVKDVEGTPVLDAYGALLGFAEMMVLLRERTGLQVTRTGAYAQPPRQLVEHLRKIGAGPVTHS
jgi:Asp/Glu/hydantoin racemase